MTVLASAGWGFVVFAVIVLGGFLLAVLQLLRMGWRVLRGDEQFEAGGSMGYQLTSPVERKRRFRRRHR